MLMIGWWEMLRSRSSTTLKVPISTIHATNTVAITSSATQDYVSSKEKLLAYNAWRIIVCSDYMRRWNGHYKVLGKIDVIYNGILREETARNDFDAGNFCQ